MTTTDTPTPTNGAAPATTTAKPARNVWVAREMIDLVTEYRERGVAGCVKRFPAKTEDAIVAKLTALGELKMNADDKVDADGRIADIIGMGPLAIRYARAELAKALK